MNNKKGTEIKRLTSQPPARPLKDEEEKAYREGEEEQNEGNKNEEEDKTEETLLDFNAKNSDNGE